MNNQINRRVIITLCNVSVSWEFLQACNAIDTVQNNHVCFVQNVIHKNARILNIPTQSLADRSVVQD